MLMSKYTTRGRASVIHSDIEITVLCKEQLDGAIMWLMEHNYNFEFSVTEGDSITVAEYHLRVPDICWANNLEGFAKVLKGSDYNSDVLIEEVK